jgi:hypothetical protein
MYIDGMVQEEVLVPGDEDQEASPEPGVPGQPTSVSSGVDAVMASTAELQAMGLTVVQGGRI